MSERDERPLDQIQFAMDELDLNIRRANCEATRRVLARAGVAVAQDIVDLGCTGLMAEAGSALDNAIFIRMNMSGSICGLPCYVPPDRFCLVHNTVGALQLVGNVDGPQVNPHPEGVALCSRELTAEERKQMIGVDALINEHAKRDAVALGLEPVDGEAVENAFDSGTSTPPPLSAGFRCPEHITPEWRCRFCLAVAVIAGPFQPMRLLELPNGIEDADQLEGVLAKGNDNTVGLYVRAAVWQRKLVREG
jgi:hypothetical protein